jgi:RNA polymerase sigma-70 factor (ECF subfamily)
VNDDRELVQAVLAGAPGAFERLVRAHQALCWHIILRMVRQPEDARELCQETFLRVHRTLHQYRFESALKSWIGRIAYHIALRHLERKRIPLLENATDDDGPSVVERVADATDVESDYMGREAAAHLHAAIETLPPQQRAVLTLYHLDELPIAEIAAITGLADGTIKSHLFRGRLRLRELLEPRIGVYS